jgi:hypothetical protein
MATSGPNVRKLFTGVIYECSLRDNNSDITIVIQFKSDTSQNITLY